MSKQLRVISLVLVVLLGSIGNINVAYGTERLRSMVFAKDHDDADLRIAHEKGYDDTSLLLKQNNDNDDASLPTEQEPNFSKDRILVKLKNNPGLCAMSFDLGINIEEMRLLNPSTETDALTPHATTNTTQNNVFVLTLEETGSEAVMRALKTLNANPAVEIAEPDYLYKLNAIPNDPQYNVQYALQKINVEKAWEITTESKNVIVGVIDTGIEGMHPDLKDNLWVNPNPNQNGYINDIHGYDFTKRRGGIPTDNNGHGTHVAGIIGAKGNNGIGIAGINWDASLAWLGILERGNEVSTSAAIEALNYANNHDIMITNNSYGGPEYSELLKQAIAYYRGLFVASAGNDGHDSDKAIIAYPASYDLPNIISVASTTETDQLSSFSNFGGNSVHVAAPGSNILSTYSGGTYEELSGTSMSAPQVAGIAALIQSINPTWSIQQVRAAICGTTRQVPELGTKVISGGIVDAYATLQVSTFINITYDFNDGVSAPVIDYIVPGNKLMYRGEAEKEGYVFKGWYTSATEDSRFDFNTVVSQDMTLYAQWTLPANGMYVIEFPDANFRREILRQLNTMDDGDRISASIMDDHDLAILSEIKLLKVGNFNINDMTGLKYFTGLEQLWCDWNWLTELDVSNNPALTTLYCQFNDLIKLDVSNNPSLVELSCVNNQLTTLDISNNPALTKLICGSNRLTALDISNNPALIELWCDFNKLTTLDISNNPALEKLYCHYNELTALNLSNKPALTRLSCQNNLLTSLDLSDNPMLNDLNCDGNRLVMLDISNNTELLSLWCQRNQLTTLDVSNKPKLRELYCDSNQITALDVSDSTLLTRLWCQTNQLTTLDVSNSPALRDLYCGWNELTTLDISNNPALERLSCARNQLSALDVSNKFNLRLLSCHNNQIASPDLVIGWEKIFNNAGSTSSSPFWFYPQNPPSSSIVILSQPKAVTNLLEGKINNAARLSMLAIASPSGSVTYQWYSNTTASSSGGALIEGQTGTSLSIPATLKIGTYYYYCVVSSDGKDDIASRVATVNIFESSTDIDITDSFTCPIFLRIVRWVVGYYQGVPSADRIMASDVADVWMIGIHESGVTSFNGIEHFTNLRIFECDGNLLTELDISHNTALEELWCYGNQLTELDISKNTALKELRCYDNNMESPDSVIGWRNYFDEAGSTKADPFWFYPQKTTSLPSLSPTPTNTPTPTPTLPVNDIEAFVTRIYQHVLERDPDAEGLAHWSNGLRIGVETGASIISHFFLSKEFIDRGISDEAFVEIAYRAIMGREAEPKGWDFWLGQLHEYSRRYVLDCFVESGEFKNLCATYDITVGELSLEAFVKRLYQHVLGRGADAEGLVFWVEGLLSKQETGATISNLFFNSPEFSSRDITNELFVRIAYLAFLDRDPDEDPIGRDYWIGKLEDGYTRSDLVSGFVASPEFAGICSHYGIEPGAFVAQSVTEILAEVDINDDAEVIANEIEEMEIEMVEDDIEEE